MGMLDGQVALVTGGGTGIGQGIALALAREGAQVVICGRRMGPLQTTIAQIEAAGGQAVAIQASVADELDVERLVEDTTEAFGPVDILVSNAGIGGGGPIHDHTIQDWDQVMGINLRGPFLMARAVLPSMRARQRGHIVNISSESGLEYYPGSGAYGVSKHALNALSEYIQRENQDLNIHVHVICPGMVISEMSQGSKGLNEDKCLRPEDIADLVLWLVTRRDNVKIGRPVLIQTMENPWE
ncbi:SDR family oxidoreductase [Aggregatilinea lenta]|uniref:SDR family oxidoreductase n=1 Tax=Aggregatilinea lenta TaxID=913108 RepID=UPI0013C2EAAF|nr:SDR family oxidoreductase [Aggregatilinea lenta]